MAEFYRFFDSTLDDVREYTAEEFSEYFRMVLTNGVYNGGTNLQAAAGGGNMTVDIKDGYAMINGYLYKVAGGVTLTLANADVTYNRIDRIVLRWDIREESRFIKAMVIKGVASKSPVAPALTRNNEIYELSLAQVLVKAGTNFIAGSDVTDERLNTSVCGIFNSRIQADTTEIFSQFNKWYNEKIPSFEKAWNDWFSKQQTSSLATKAELEACKTEVGVTISSHVDETSRQSTVLQHGVSVINGEVTSPADIEVQGRTLTSLSNSVLESSKYYVLADKKTKLKWADSSITTGVAKFAGKAEKPTVIRIANFEGKVVASTLENPHIAKRTNTGFNNKEGLLTPTEFSSNSQTTEVSTTIEQLDASIITSSTNISGKSSQHIFSFNIIEEVERNIGKIPGSTTAEKVQWLRNNIGQLYCVWHGYGSSPTGYKASIARWSDTNTSWNIQTGTNTNGSIGRLSTGGSSNHGLYIDSNGFYHLLAYAEPSDGTTASTIYTDYVELEIELKPTATLNSACVPLYEVDSDEYSKILGEWDENAVLSRYPKVEGMQHLQGLAMFVEGANLISPFTEKWNLDVNTKIIGNYEITLEGTTSSPIRSIYLNLTLIPNTQYTFSIEADGEFAIYKATPNHSGTDSALVAYNRGNKATFTTDSRTEYRVYLRTSSSTPLKCTFKNPMLTLGSTQKPFVPYNPSHLFADVKLGQSGTTKDMLYKQDGQWFVRKAIEKDVELDGSLDFSFQSNRDGYKWLKCTHGFLAISDYTNNTAIAVKFNGRLFNQSPSLSGVNEFILYDRSHANKGQIVFTVDNVDTGFADSYTPTADEVKAYFNGWQVKTADSANKPTAWKSIVDGTDAPTQTLAYVKANKAPNYTPYKLSYVLATPQIINVTDKVEGDIVVNGLTQVEVTSGVVVREKVTPVYYATGDYYYINDDDLVGGKTKYKAERVISVYKNTVKDTLWEVVSTGRPFGKQRVRIKGRDFDPTAEYTVTYLALDRHQMTVNATEVKATYANNMRSALDDVVVKQSDIEMSIKTAYDLAEQALQSTNDNKTKISQAETDIQEINDTRMLKVLKTNKDSEGIFKTVTYKRKSDNTIYCVSTLSGGTTPLYTTRTEKYYDATGKTVIATHVYTLSYDDDGELVSEV